MRLGEIVQNTLKGGGTEKRGGEAKILKSEGGGGQTWSRYRYGLKAGEGDLDPTYRLCNMN